MTEETISPLSKTSTAYALATDEHYCPKMWREIHIRPSGEVGCAALVHLPGYKYVRRHRLVKRRKPVRRSKGIWVERDGERVPMIVSYLSRFRDQAGLFLLSSCA